MSDINLDFVVSNNSINFTVEPNDITITPTDIQLNVSAAGLAVPSSPVFGVQFNNSGTFGATENFKFYPGNSTIAVTNILVGNNANFTSDVNDVRITGGTNGYVLQTDGTGNLSWTAQTGGGGNGTPGGANTQIQYNDNGLFGGNVGFTFNEVTGNVDIPGNLIVSGNISGTIGTPTQNNITSVGTLVNLNVTGNITGRQYTGALGGLPYGLENVAIIGAQTGTYNMDLISNAIQFSTANATANVILNFRGNSSTTANTLIANGQSITSTYVMTNGSTPYTITSIQIDGATQTVNWAGGLTPTTYANTKVAYTLTLIKTSTTPTYIVLGSGTRYN